MRHKVFAGIRPLLVSVVTAAALCCGDDAMSQQPAAPEKAPEKTVEKTEGAAEGKSETSEYNLTLTVREIIQAMVVPQSDAIWNAVASSTTARGTVFNFPANNEGWTALRHQAVQLAEAANLIMMPGRHMAKPGEKAQDPRTQLAPEAIEELVKGNRADWVKFSRAMYDGSLAVVAAIDARSPEALTAAADRLTPSCDGCHRKYWFPRQGFDSPRRLR